jgi:RNase H-fold protein (predicted Holliday junction resolvase)
VRILGVDASTVRCGFAVVDGPLSSPTLTSHSELKFGLKTAHKARRQLAAAHIMRIAAEESTEVLVIERIRLF